MFSNLSITSQYYIREFLQRLVSIELNDKQADYLIAKIEERRRAGIAQSS